MVVTRAMRINMSDVLSMAGEKKSGKLTYYYSWVYIKEDYRTILVPT
jgi:hypothetical protein